MCLGIAAALAVGLCSAWADDEAASDGDHRIYAIGLWGDLPYSAAQETTALPPLIGDMNKADLAFTVHDGDLKAGSNSECDNALYSRALDWFNALDAPAMFTPGDNDWVDCDRATNGGFNSLERLDHERKVFFGAAESMGRRRLPQEMQSDGGCLSASGGTASCVENRRWTLGGVTYLTVNAPGSCNNLCDDDPDPAEFSARDAANIRWLKAGFQAAKERRSAAVMIISQANPGFDETGAQKAIKRNPRTLVAESQPDGFQAWLLALREEAIAFGRPVAYVHGDTHYMRIDKPLLDRQGRRLDNFTRIETFGESDAHWLKVVVDPGSREVFSYQPQIVPANRAYGPSP